MNYKALIKQLNAEGEAIALPLSSTQIITIGRDHDCQIILDSNQYQGVSRHHAQIRPLATNSPTGEPSWEICDLQSSNGTFVNDIKIMGCARLQAGDRIRLGSAGVEFILELQQEVKSSPVASSNVQLWFYLLQNWRKSIYFASWGALGSLVGALAFVPFGGGWKLCASSTLEAVLLTAAEGAINGACMTIALLSAFSFYLGRGFKWSESIKKGLWVGLVVGGIAGAISDIIYISLGASNFTQALCWGIGGGMIGFGLSFRIPNLGKWRGLLGGLIGGLLGGASFVAIGKPNVECSYLSPIASDVPTAVRGYLLGMAILGFLIGLMIVIVELVFRKAWLEVGYRNRQPRTITLGSEGTKFGSDPTLCNVCVEMVPPVALHYKFDKGKIILEDVSNGTKTVLQPGDRRELGTITITVCANQQQ